MLPSRESPSETVYSWSECSDFFLRVLHAFFRRMLVWLLLSVVLGTGAECPEFVPGMYMAELGENQIIEVKNRGNENFFEVFIPSLDGHVRYRFEYSVSSECLIVPSSRSMWRKVLFDIWFASGKKFALGQKISYDEHRLVLGDLLELTRV